MGKLGKKDRKKKSNKYENLSKPQAELDFHGLGRLTMGEIRGMTDNFIEKCRDRKLSKVIIITGKGLHSKKGMPIIKPYLRKYLSAKPYVLRVMEGRFDRGGSGTLEITFRHE